MKKLIVIMLCTVLVTGCGAESGISQEQYESVVAERDELKEQVQALENEIASKAEDNEQKDTSQDIEENNEETTTTKNEEEAIEVLAEYTLPDGIGWYTRHFIIVRNISNETVDVSSSSLAYSEDGTMVGAANASFDALGPECTSVMYEAFETDAEINYYETEIESSKSKYYKSVIQDLSYVQNDIDKGAVFQITNDGEEAAKFVEGYALFFSNGELVGYDNIYFTDDDSEIKPGKTISKQLTSNKDFDFIEFYMTGRK